MVQNIKTNFDAVQKLDIDSVAKILSKTQISVLINVPKINQVNTSRTESTNVQYVGVSTLKNNTEELNKLRCGFYEVVKCPSDRKTAVSVPYAD